MRGSGLQVRALCRLRVGRLCCLSGGDAYGIVLQLLEDGIGTLHYALGHTGNLGNMNTETVLTATANKFAQEDYLVVHLADGDVVVAYACKRSLHLVEFVVVCGEQRLGVALVLMDVLHDRPCDAYTVVGRCAATQFVKQHQTALAQVVKDAGSLVHLHHEG